MQDEGLCEKVKVSGLGLPAEMVSYSLNGCAPQFALWSFVDLGYLTYYTAYLIATGALKAEDGAKVHRRPHGRLHHHQGPDPRRGPPRPDGALLGLVREAAKEEIVIMRHGKPAGVLIGFDSEDDWFDYKLETDPRFAARIAKARQSLRAGLGVRLEELDAVLPDKE
jgi:PHD/YefM family antitoxin component YafN of YafNO toxin-antitoxin module